MEAHDNQVVRRKGCTAEALFSRFTYKVSKQNSKLVLIQNCQTTVYGGFSAGLRYIERKSAIEGTTNQKEDADIFP